MAEISSAQSLNSSKVMTRVFLPFAFGHCTSFLFRNINAVLTPFLISAMSLSAGQLGILSSAYFFSFSLAQLPVGLALDRYGPKRVQLFLLGIAVAGAVLFGIGQNFTTLLLARILIGLGLAACFMGSIKVLSFWVPDRKLPSIHGYLLAAGGLGAMLSTLPVAWLVGFVSWRTLFFAMAGVTLIVMIAIAIWVPKDPIEHKMVKWPSLASLLDVYRDHAFRKVISLLLLPHTVAFGLQGLWMGKWLQDVGHYSNTLTSVYLFVGMGAVVVGSLSVGAITEWAGKFNINPMEVGGIGIALFLTIQVLCVFNIVPLLPVLSVGFTLIGTIAGLEYTIVAQNVSPAMTGRAATCLNLLILFGAFLTQTVFGVIIDFWSVDAAGHYPQIAYQVAFGFMILLQAPGFIKWLISVIKSGTFKSVGDEL
ncbi:MFS transporter [Xenorhabdus bovienii]|uniref:Carbohydrate transport membrane protein n=1 Tax=Xenorhabdus bovienii str. kraussei Becker Underwood TaxID=1398204 RepID=A0A077PGZ3_XENBV|nr:MFS transporter [Xenorhabdus bovienii]CDH23585.1 Carbohydrate transport membrane protein [Xenorhabdus bovienii str. kraussei Becker Underwood]